ncbi:hypothetical protein D9M68_354200 [compost metagenome]
MGAAVDKMRHQKNLARFRSGPTAAYLPLLRPNGTAPPSYIAAAAGRGVLAHLKPREMAAQVTLTLLGIMIPMVEPVTWSRKCNLSVKPSGS